MVLGIGKKKPIRVQEQSVTRPRGRPPGSKNSPTTRSMTPAEREEGRFLRELRKSNPARWVEIMEQRMGIVHEPEKAKSAQGSDLETTLKTLAMLKRAGLLSEGQHSIAKGRLGELREVLDSELGKKVGEGLGIGLGRLLGADQGMPLAELTTGEEGAAAQQAAQQPAVQPAQPGAQSPAQRTAAILDSMTPAQAAEWMLSNLPTATVLAIARVDLARPETLRAALAADAGPFADWLIGRGQWTRELTAALHRLVYGAPASPATPAAASPVAAPSTLTPEQIVAALTPLTPDQAAAWALANLPPDVLAQLAGISPGQEAVVLALAPMQAPELAPLTNWLRGRLPWTVQTLAALRAQQQAHTPSL